MPGGLLHMLLTLLFGLSFLPVRSKRHECLLSIFEQKLCAATTTCMSLWNAVSSVQTIIVCRFPSVYTASSGSLQPSSFTVFVSQLFLQVSAAALAQTRSSFPCASLLATSSSFSWRSSVVSVQSDCFLTSSSSVFVMNLSLITAYCCSWHLHM